MEAERATTKWLTKTKTTITTITITITITITGVAIIASIVRGATILPRETAQTIVPIVIVSAVEHKWLEAVRTRRNSFLGE